jgi:hypothetical protein
MSGMQPRVGARGGERRVRSLHGRQQVGRDGRISIPIGSLNIQQGLFGLQ